ncbi:Fic family protein [Inquilinus ginsengisoli]|uniref:Fic family protein n=1 Tax=Inquilinus ginsengisoli TaxID=363840 RepID=A0ABU1JIQ4_9PROT|nr:Fic family protein [Inquilinus ginsengisoli]MDR6288476.1 Fic family protein [Inquilinus ginsengisoli]
MKVTFGIGMVSSDGRYLSWDEARVRQPPGGLSTEDWWFTMRRARALSATVLPFGDKRNKAFSFCEPPVLRSILHWIDAQASGQILTETPAASSAQRDRYIMTSLIEEAFASSVLEGAATTRQAAREMIRDHREPRSLGEQMVLNNYRAMEFVREHANQPLTPAIILELHRVVTEGTLEKPEMAGRLRRAKDDVKVVDPRDGEVLHIPPEADTLPQRLDAFCAFANDLNPPPDKFIHPVVRAIILHFMIGYDHPFIDGNGRTARALFYWSLLRQKYWLMEFISISSIIRRSPVQYAKAYLNSELDHNDLTYFLLNQTKVVRLAIEGLQNYLARKAREIELVETWLDGTPYEGRFNHRQLDILKTGARSPGAQVTVDGHKNKHRVSYHTARADLEDLLAAGLLRKRQIGRGKAYVAPSDLAERLQGKKGRS